MKFEEAIECMKSGERIKRGHWKKAHLFMEKGRVKMRLGFQKPWHYNFRNTDIMANDWLIDTNHMFVDDDTDSQCKPLTGYLTFDRQ